MNQNFNAPPFTAGEPLSGVSQTPEAHPPLHPLDGIVNLSEVAADLADENESKQVSWLSVPS